jgi:hypothetical protein
VQGVLAQTDDRSLHTASARARLAQSDQLIQTIANQTLAASLAVQSAAIQATLAQGDAAKADDDAAALLIKVHNLARDETDQAAQRIKADLMKHELSDKQIADLNLWAKTVDMDAKLALAQADLAKMRQFAATVTASLPAAVQLPGFAWSQANASAVKKQAVTAGLFKDQDTGMSAALGKVTEARGKVAGFKGMDFPTQRELLRDIIASHNGFGGFIDAKLRGLSRNPGWQAYCDDAAAKVKAEVDKLLQVIQKLEQTASAAAPKVVLPPFTWDPASATAVKKQAVKAGLFKDQETGMTAELGKIAPVRARLAQANSLPVAPRRTLLKNGSDAYKAFGSFVAAKLRGLSKDPSWARYCDSAADQVKQETDKLQQQLAAISG